MPPGRIRKLDPPGDLFIIGDDEQPYHIGTFGSLSLNEREYGTWSADVGMTEWSAELEGQGIPWKLRVIYAIGARKQRKTALEKRRRRNGKR